MESFSTTKMAFAMGITEKTLVNWYKCGLAFATPEFWGNRPKPRLRFYVEQAIWTLVSQEFRKLFGKGRQYKLVAQLSQLGPPLSVVRLIGCNGEKVIDLSGETDWNSVGRSEQFPSYEVICVDSLLDWLILCSLFQQEYVAIRKFATKEERDCLDNNPKPFAGYPEGSSNELQYLQDALFRRLEDWNRRYVHRSRALKRITK
jgi:hypothetical protein